MLGGFTFKGIHSSVYGVFETPRDQVLFPEKRRSLIQIPGRSEAFVQEDGGYNARVESILCTYVAPEGANLQRQCRLIAGWLDGIGELTYDYEPEMHYNAFLSSSPPTVKQMSMQYAAFELEFTINHPFAYETAQELKFDLNSGDSFTITTDGTVSTPIRLIIKNTGANTIHNLIVVSKFIND